MLLLCCLAALQVYGSYYRKLSKRVQSALAEANAVAEEVLSAMATVSLTVQPVRTCALHCGMFVVRTHMSYLCSPNIAGKGLA